MVEEILVPRAKRRVLHLLERQERTRAKLMERLLSDGYPSFVASEAIDYAAGYNYVNDERYARTYVFYHKENMPARRLRMELIRRGIDKELADCVLEEEYDSDEEKMIDFFLEKRHYDRGTSDRRERAKMYRYLLSKGFSAGGIKKALDVTAPFYR